MERLAPSRCNRSGNFVYTAHLNVDVWMFEFFTAVLE
jgi:hypothetical protein